MTPPGHAIEDTIATLRRRVAASPQDIQAYLDLSDALAELIDADGTRPPVAADADEPIKLLRAAAELAADEHPGLRAAILVDLGQKVTWRFEVLLEDGTTPEDQLQRHADDAISCFERALDSAAEADVTEQFISAELAAVAQLVDLLRLRFTVLGEIGDLSAVIELEQQILGVLTAEDETGPDEDRVDVLYQLGVDFAARHDLQTESAQDDLDQAIACLRELRELIGDDHSGRPELATRLGLLLGYHVLQAVDESAEQDFADAVAELTLARGAPTPEAEQDAADLWLVRFRLGMVHAFRYLNRGGDAADRDAAVAELSELADHPDTTTEQADRCHLTLAQLEHLRTAPKALRSDPELLTAGGQARLWDTMSSLATAHSADTARAIRHHLDAMSESAAADPQLSTPTTDGCTPPDGISPSAETSSSSGHPPFSTPIADHCTTPSGADVPLRPDLYRAVPIRPGSGRSAVAPITQGRQSTPHGRSALSNPASGRWVPHSASA